MRSESGPSEFVISHGCAWVKSKALLIGFAVSLCSIAVYAQNSAVGFVSASTVPEKHDVQNVIAGEFDRNYSVDVISYGYDWDYGLPAFFATLFLSNSNGTFAQ